MHSGLQMCRYKSGSWTGLPTTLGNGEVTGVEMIRKMAQKQTEISPGTEHPQCVNPKRSISISYKPLRQKLHHIAQHVLGIGVCETTIFLPLYVVIAPAQSFETVHHLAAEGDGNSFVFDAVGDE